MSESVNGFIGTWQVKLVTGGDSGFPPGTLVRLGEPFLDETTNEVAVGFAIQTPAPDSSGVTTVLSSQDTPDRLHFRGGVLFFDGHIAGDPNQQRLRVYIALAETVNETARFLYGTTLRGDPDQVAVWGATDHTPP